MYIFYTEKHCWFVILIICVSAFNYLCISFYLYYLLLYYYYIIIYLYTT